MTDRPPAARTSGRGSRAVTIFTVALLVAGPPLDYLRYHHYPLLSPEVLLPGALWLVCAIGIGSLLNRASRPVRILAFTILLLVFIDWQFSNRVDLPYRLLVVAVLVTVWLLERRMETIVAVATAAFYLASLPSSSPIRASRMDFPEVRGDTSLPAVLYLILDEHIGVEGWPEELAGTREMQQRVRQFYLGEGFRLFGKAYSEYAETDASIPAVLNWPIEEPYRDVAEVVSGESYALKANAFFEKLSAKGYRIRVYQSTYLDYCDERGVAIRSCDTWPANSIRNLSLDPMPLWDKARLVGLYFLQHNSHVYVRLRDVLLRLLVRQNPGVTGQLPWWSARIYKSVFPGAMQLLAHLQNDLRADDPRGTLYFAHLLSPHHPYEVDAACRSQTRPTFWLDLPATNTPAERAWRYGLYAGQTECLYRHLTALFQMIDSIPALRHMVVIVHGDHGSRIVLHYPLKRLLASMQPSDFTDGFSALFAIRAPGIPAGYDRQFAPINDLVGHALASGFTRIDVPDTGRHFVKLDSGFDVPFLMVRLSDTSLARPTDGGGAAARH